METYIVNRYKNDVVEYMKYILIEPLKSILNNYGYITYPNVVINTNNPPYIKCTTYLIDINRDFSKRIDTSLLFISNKIKSDIRNEKLNILIDERK